MTRAGGWAAAVALLGWSGLGCSVEFLADAAPRTVTNSCKVDVDCGMSASCFDGACYAKSGVIDEVLLEIVPPDGSAYGGVSFLSEQVGIKIGDRSRSIDLPSRSGFVTQVVANGSDLMGCPYLMTGRQTLAARIEFSRTGAVGGIPILGVASIPLTVDTAHLSGGWNVAMDLLPGTYDVYVQPVTSPTCQLAPRILRGVTVADQVEAWSPPATIELPTPTALNGAVQRTGGGTLLDWQVDIVEPQEGRVISTSARLGPTDGPSNLTNFRVTYQPLLPSPIQAANRDRSSSQTTNGPLIRISPPASLVDTAPTVYWDLAAADINGVGQCNLDMTGVPRPDKLVTVAGQIRRRTGDPNVPDGQRAVRSNLRFYSVSLDGATGLTATFNRSVLTDDAGRYTTKLFPGQYRVVAIPVAPGPDGQVVPSPASRAGDSPPAPAITEEQWMITGDPTQTVDLTLSSKSVFAAYAKAPMITAAAAALGATFEADPTVLPSQVGVLKGALAQTPVLSQSASALITEADGHFTLPLDPGNFDLSLRAPESSNFAWWVRPATHVPTDTAQPLDPTLLLTFPVPLEGVITVPDPNPAVGRQPLRNAAVRAYAKVPTGTGVTKVGDTRTDGNGRYRLRLPPRFMMP